MYYYYYYGYHHHNHHNYPVLLYIEISCLSRQLYPVERLYIRGQRVAELRETLYIFITAIFSNKSVWCDSLFILPVQSIAQDKCRPYRETNFQEINPND
jgi:hypothetical protein